MASKDMKRKVYSPDIMTYSFEGTSAIYKTVSSFFIGPVRLVMRVMHNIMLLPADLLGSYASGLLIIGSAMGILGVVDYVAFHKWPLLISQIPVLLLAWWFRKRASLSQGKSEELREVDINTDTVSQMCDDVYKELNAIFGKEEK